MGRSPEFYLFSLICLRYQSRWTWLCSESLGKFLPAFHGLLFLLKAKHESQTSVKVIAIRLMERDKILKDFFSFLNLES